MANTDVVRPTFWRTCRVLANRPRLRMFGVIVHGPERTVSIIAKKVHVPVAVASQYLRALEAHGFLKAQRNKRWVEYRLLDAGLTEPTQALPAILAGEFTRKKAMETVFRLVTAFTHPRRIEVYRALACRAQTLQELVVSTGIPWRPLLRHLSKLKTRGFVVHRGLRPRKYAVTEHPNAFGRALAEAAVEGLDASPGLPEPIPQSLQTLDDPPEFID